MPCISFGDSIHDIVTIIISRQQSSFIASFSQLRVYVLFWRLGTRFAESLKNPICCLGSAQQNWIKLPHDPTGSFSLPQLLLFYWYAPVGNPAKVLCILALFMMPCNKVGIAYNSTICLIAYMIEAQRHHLKCTVSRSSELCCVKLEHFGYAGHDIIIQCILLPQINRHFIFQTYLQPYCVWLTCY